MSNKILVIGATGNIGHTLVRLLAEKGAMVKAATRQPHTYTAQTGVEAVAFDYDRPESYAPALAGVDRVFAIPKNADPVAQETLNPFIDAAKAAGVSHVVLSTAMGVDQAPPDLGYRQVELHLMQSGMAYTILRPNWFMQNFNPGFILPMIQQGGAIYLPAGDAPVSFIDTHDIAAVAAKVLTEPVHGGREYTLTGGTALTYAEAAALISKAAGREIRYVPVPDEAMREALTGAGWWSGQVELMVGLFGGVRQGWAAPVVPTLAELLGRAPITLAQFAAENAEAWR